MEPQKFEPFRSGRTIPLQPVSFHHGKPVQTPDKPKILIVNDDPASLFALDSLLARWSEENDCEVLTARKAVLRNSEDVARPAAARTAQGR